MLQVNYKKVFEYAFIGKYGNIVEVCPYTKALAKAKKNLHSYTYFSSSSSRIIY